MKHHHQADCVALHCAPLNESRTARFNLPILGPGRWRFLLDSLISSPMRIHRLRSLSVQMFESVADEIDGKKCDE